MTLADLIPRVEPRERKRFYLAAAAFMCVATSALVARALGDTLFLSRLGSERLPLMYVLGALVTGLGAWACARAAPRVATARIGTFVAAVLILANLGVYLTLTVLPVFSRSTAYVLADVSGRIPILLYWALATEIFDARESRRLFGLLGAVGTMACLPTGLLVGPLARRFGVSALILIVCALLAGFILAANALESRESKDWARGERKSLVAAGRRTAGQLHRKSQFVTIAGLAALTALVQTVVDYQFKASFSAQASGADLAAIFGRLYGWASLAALVLQLFLVHRILRWGGVRASLWLLPAGLLVASVAVLRSASAASVYMVKTIDVTLSLTVNGTARQMLYRGIRSESRLQARALAEGLYQPMAIAVAGCALAATVGLLNVRTLAAVIIAGCLAWILMARSTYSSYVAGLLSSLRAARFEPGDQALTAHEPAVKTYAMDALTSAPDEQIKYLAAVLPNVLPLAEHTDPEVRWTVVRAAAAGEFPATEAWLRARLADPHPRVRAFAAAGLINSGKKAAATEGRIALDTLVFTDSPADRQAAAEGIGEIRSDAPGPWLAFLLRADEEDVLSAALEACRSHPDPTFIRAILPLLGRRRLAGEAADALVACGADSIVPTASLLRRTPGRRRAEMIKHLARALARDRDPAALPLLERMSRVVGPEDRDAVYQAYGEIARLRAPSRSSVSIDRLISREAQDATRRLADIRELGSSPATRLLHAALEYLVKCHVRHVFMLLDVRVRNVDMMSLYSTLGRGTRESRSQVVELLHNVLPESLEDSLLELLVESGEPSEQGTDPRAAVERILARPAPESVTAAALHAAVQLGLDLPYPHLRRFLTHQDPIVRETALAALTREKDRSIFLNDVRRLTVDSDEAVRELAVALSRDI